MKETDGRVLMVQGRIVWASGDLFKGQLKTKFGSKEPVLDEQGQQVREYGFGLAIPKTSLNSDPDNIWTVLHSEAMKLFPQIPPGFAMKFKDGDGVDDKGQPFSSREGYAGHIVLSCITRIPIQWYIFQNGQNIITNEGIKCGDYVNVQLQVRAHGAIGQGKPGLYVNPLAVQLVGYGKEIVNRPQGNDIFGMSQPAVPQGASATPIAPQGDQLLVAQPVTPNYGVLPQVHQPQPQPATAPSYPQTPQGFPQPATTPQSAPVVGGMPMPPGFQG